MNFFKSSMLGVSINAMSNSGHTNYSSKNNTKKGGEHKKGKLRFNGEPETRTAEQRCLLRWSR